MILFYDSPHKKTGEEYDIIVQSELIEKKIPICRNRSVSAADRVKTLIRDVNPK